MSVQETDRTQYDAFRVARAVETSPLIVGSEGPTKIEQGELRRDPLCSDEPDRWCKDYVKTTYAGADANNTFCGLVDVEWETIGIIEFPRPMTWTDADVWLMNNPEKWERFEAGEEGMLQ